MKEIARIPVADLLLDRGNPRLSEEQPDQQAAALELVREQPDQVLNLAQDIVEKGGLDPTALIAVVPTGDRRKRYRVAEGNRRVLALKALETPALVSAALTSRQNQRLARLSRSFSDNPIEAVDCVLFDAEEEVVPWVILRHTGQNEGRGLVSWSANEQDRYTARHKGRRKPAGQLLDFVDKHGALSAEARASSRGVITNVERILETPDARQAIGVDVVRGQVLALYPLGELAKTLTRVVEDFKTGRVTVGQLYHRDDRINYVNSLPRSAKPKKSTRLPEPVIIDDLTAGERRPRPVEKAPKRPTRRSTRKARTTIVPEGARLDVTPPRVNAIYYELAQLNAEQFPNACSVLLRVFIELSVDHHIDSRRLMSEADARNKPLAKRLKTAAADLQASGAISAKLKRAVDSVADGPSVIAPGVPTFNLYVHNPYTFPKSRELYTAWDELAPFLEALWP